MCKVRNKIVTSILILALVVLGSCFVGRLNAKVLANETDSISQEMLSALSVKCQVKENTNGSADLRVVSTVDELESYGTAGFDIYVEGRTEPIRYEKSHVTDQIGAKENGVSFEYNPKVFDTISKYFITVTVTGIPSTDFGYGFLIKPFVTLEGSTERLYGTSRYVKINDALEGYEYLSVPVSKLSDTTGFSVKVGDTTYSGSNVEFYNDSTNDGNYTHARVKLDSTALASLTKVSVLDANSSPVANTTYRNLYSTSVTADKTWYNNADSGETEYVLVTKADLYGFAEIVNTTSERFANKTIHLGADIKVNTITLNPETYEDETAWNEAVSGCVEWIPIGGGVNSTDHRGFAGTFNGENQTISGLYFESDGYYLGLFGALAINGSSTIQNLKLTNSYFESTRTDVMGAELDGLGSIAGQGAGIIDTVYSDVILVNGTRNTGGLVGNQRQANSPLTVTNCWYDGDITGTYWIGGILGFVDAGIAYTNMTNCLVTADITGATASTSTYYQIGGLAGRAINGTFTSCVAVGTLTSSYSMGGLIGRTYIAGTNKVNVVKCYNATNQANICHPDTTIASSSAVKKVSEADLQGQGAFTNTLLDFYVQDINDDGKWVATNNSGLLKLKSFAEESTIDGLTDTTRTLTPDTTWYGDGSADEFIIWTEEDLYGLAKLCNADGANGGTRFAEKTIKMGMDIEVNYGLATDWANGQKVPNNWWTPIGGGTGSNETGKTFAGIFDGQSHSISGLYMKKSSGYFLGLFGWLTTGSEIKDLKLLNSYFEVTDEATLGPETDGFGSIAGQGAGKINSVYSDAILVSKKRHVGGLVGSVRIVDLEMSNCCYAGNATGLNKIGGLVGYVYSDRKLSVYDCLVTATLKGTDTSTSVYSTIGGIGGFCGANSDITIERCVIVGNIDSNYSQGGLVGYAYSSNKIKATNCFHLMKRGTVVQKECERTTLSSTTNVHKMDNADALKGTSGYTSYLSVLGFYDATSNPEGKWVLIENKLPELRSFTTENYLTTLPEVRTTE